MARAVSGLTVKTVPVKLSIITAVASPRAKVLRQTAVSVAATRELLKQHGHACLWVVCVMGPKESFMEESFIEEVIDKGHRHGSPDERESGVVVVRLPGHHSMAAARNVAASRALDGWVLPLEAGDELHPKGVLALVETIDLMDHDIVWVAHNRERLDGSHGPYWIETNKFYAEGELAAAWRPDLFHPGSVAYDSAALFKAGGWPATPGGEDLALLLRMASLYSGAMVTPVASKERRFTRPEADSEHAELQALQQGLYERFKLLDVNGFSGLGDQ